MWKQQVKSKNNMAILLSIRPGEYSHFLLRKHQKPTLDLPDRGPRNHGCNSKKSSKRNETRKGRDVKLDDRRHDRKCLNQERHLKSLWKLLNQRLKNPNLKQANRKPETVKYNINNKTYLMRTEPSIIKVEVKLALGCLLQMYMMILLEGPVHWTGLYVVPANLHPTKLIRSSVSIL